jgi:hypothetical protein
MVAFVERTKNQHHKFERENWRKLIEDKISLEKRLDKRGSRRVSAFLELK